MSQHTPWLLFSPPWLSDSWSHGPSFNIYLWQLIWAPAWAFWFLFHHSALIYTHTPNVKVPISLQKLGPFSFSKRTLDTPPPEHLWVCGVVLSWELSSTPSTPSPYLPARCVSRTTPGYVHVFMSVGELSIFLIHHLDFHPPPPASNPWF